jgi:hypothetical protein
MARSTTFSRLIIVMLAASSAAIAQLGQAVELANIDAPGPATGTTTTGPPTLSIPSGESTPNFFVEPATAAGFYPIRIGGLRSDDYAGGVLLASSRENAPRIDGLGAPVYGIPGVSTNPSSGGAAIVDGNLSIYVRNRAGVTTNVRSNVNVAAAYFPFSEGWIGAHTRNTANGGAPNNTSSVNGVTVNDLILGFSAVESGISRITIPGVTDTRQQGLLFANHSKDEDNRASVAPSPTGDAFILGMQNGGNAMTPEPDPYAFVYIPYGTPNVTMASIHGASGVDQHPTVMKSSGLPFTITRTAVGTYRLSIPGQTPSSGALLVNAGGQISTGATSVSDNHFTYQADGNDWVIQSLDWGSGTATLVDPFLETPLAERSQSFQFAFMPFATPPTAPGPNPTPFDLKDKVFAFQLQETEVDAAQQANPANYGVITAQTPGFNVQHLRQDRGDNSVAVNGFFPAQTDGIMFGTISQGFRDNTVLPNNPSGQASFGMIAAGDAGGGWEFATHTIDPGAVTGALQEFNVNFSGVFFGKDTGFQMAHQVAQPPLVLADFTQSDGVNDADFAAWKGGYGAATGGTKAEGDSNNDGDVDGSDFLRWQQEFGLPEGGLKVSLPGVNTKTSGILVAQAHGNVDQYAVATPSSDGSNWNILTFNNETTPTNNAINWLYLPYTANNLVAGRVAADGTVLSSTGVGTNPGQFTLTRQSDGAYLLTVAGKTPADGTLLLTPEGSGVDDNSLVYEASGNSFLITGVDFVTMAERAASTTPSAQDTPFTFAFIDYNTPPTLPGSTAGSGIVPEPASGILALAALGWLAARRRGA